MFRNWSFRTKLAVVLLPPILMLGILAITAISPKLSQRAEAAQNTKESVYARAAMGVLNSIQVERSLALTLAASKGQTGRNAFAEGRAETDRKIKVMQSKAGQLPSGNRQLKSFVATGESVAKLPQIRANIEDLSLEPEQAELQYTVMAVNLTNLISSLVSQAGDSRLLRQATLIDRWIRTKELIARENALLTRITVSGKYEIADYGKLKGLAESQTRFIENFQILADADTLEQFNQLAASPEFNNADTLALYAMQAGESSSLPPFTAAEWVAAADARLTAVAVLDEGLFVKLAQLNGDVSSKATSSVLKVSLLAVIGAMLALAGAALLANSIVRRIRRLAADAQTIATDRLPEVLEAMRNPSPEALATGLPSVNADAKDELGVLAESFNTVLRTSVETALHHAQQRAKTLTNMLVNLGRRNQGLIDRQLELIDRLESQQHDQELLEDLFRLDHMVTRMRRNAENLLVLASEQPARQWSESVPVLDVLRGAASEVQAISRVEIEVPAANNLPLLGRHAVDISHLVAELIENSTAFSPPSSMVNLRTERVGDVYRVWVIDTGVGMDDDDLVEANDRLASPPDIDTLTADRVGFQVVGRLARRLGVAVSLQDNPGGGVAATVDLPMSLFEVLPAGDSASGGKAPRSDRSAKARRDRQTAMSPVASSRSELAAEERPGVQDRRQPNPQAPRRPADRPAPAPAPATAAKTPPAVPVIHPAAPTPPRRRLGSPASEPKVAVQPAAVREPTPVAAKLETPAAPADAPSEVTAEGLVRRKPGSAYSGNATAAAVDQGVFRRLPAPGATGKPAAAKAPPAALDDNDEEDDAEARRRLSMMSSLRSGVTKGRELADGADDADPEGDPR